MTQDAVSFSESCVAALLSWSLISTRSTPLCYGSVVIEPPLIVTGVVHVRSHWRRVPSGPEAGPPRRGSRVSRFLEWFHGQGDYVHDYPGNRVWSERGLGRDALAKKARSRECVRKLEAGVYDLTVGTLQRLATAPGVQ